MQKQALTSTTYKLLTTLLIEGVPLRGQEHQPHINFLLDKVGILFLKNSPLDSPLTIIIYG